MRYPNFLKKNDTIALVAPSFGCTQPPYSICMDESIRKFEDAGYKIIEGPNARKDDGIGISSTPENCGRELTDFYCSTDNDMLISCGGGELMCETMDFVDIEAVKNANPKWYMGYSDNTNFSFVLNTVCDVAAIYGPSIGAFGASSLHQCHKDAIGLFTGEKLTVSGYDTFELESLKSEENPLASYNLTEKKKLKLFIGEREVDKIPDFEGRLIGGCGDVLANLIGTQFDNMAAFNEKYAHEGIIWFIEFCDLNNMSIRRALWHLDRAGWLKNVKGFIIGRPLAAFGEVGMGLDQYTAVTGILSKFNVPIIMDADIGHIAPAMPLISGAHARVHVGDGNISLEHELV